MKKIKNKFLYFILFLISIVVGVVVYMSFFNQNIDRNSYVELISGSGYLNGVSLSLGEKEKLKENDEVKTGSGNSMVIIEWGDGSITRLGKNTHLKIDENYFSDDGDIVKVIFKIFSGETWSNVLSYIPGDSHFKQVFDDAEVAIRGTVYTINLEKKYLYVENHRVLLKDKDGKIIEVNEKKPISTKTFDFISLSDFILKLKDKDFFKENKILDKKLYLILKQELNKQLKNLEKLKNLDIQKLTDEEIKRVYKDVLVNYQKLNFISTKDGRELFSLKIDLKEKLMNLSSPLEKANLAQSFFYDFKDIVTNKRFYSFDKITKVLIENKEYFDFESFLDLLKSLEVTEFLEKSVKEDIKNLKKSFNISVDIGTKIIDKVNDLDKKAREGIIDLKNKVEDELEDSINKVIDSKENFEKKADDFLKESVDNLEGVINDNIGGTKK